jgi:hypothetical protein
MTSATYQLSTEAFAIGEARPVSRIADDVPSTAVACDPEDVPSAPAVDVADAGGDGGGACPDPAPDVDGTVTTPLVGAACNRCPSARAYTRPIV